MHPLHSNRSHARHRRVPGGVSLALTLWLVAVGHAGATEPETPEREVKLELGRESSLRLEGNSTLHAFSSVATRLRLSGAVRLPTANELNEETVRVALGAEGGLQLRLEIPVVGLKSGDSRLDENMYETLKHKQHPLIVFQLDGVGPADGELIPVQGRLTVAGRQRPLKVLARVAERVGGVRAVGSAELLMTDFGVEPPTFFLVLKTDDRVVIHFDLELRPEGGLKTNAEARRLSP